MEFEELENKWKKSFEDSLRAIKGYTTPNQYDTEEEKGCKAFMKWIVEGEEDPYYFLPSNFAYMRNNIFDTELFLNTLHHALLDDGDVVFVTTKINGKTESIRLMFVDPYIDQFISIVHKEEANLIKFKKESYEHSVRFINKINEKNLADGKKLKELPKEFKIEDLDITFHYDAEKFQTEVIDFIKSENERRIEMEQKRKEFLGKINHK